jgi:hypothetical protein
MIPASESKTVAASQQAHNCTLERRLAGELIYHEELRPSDHESSVLSGSSL